MFAVGSGCVVYKCGSNMDVVFFVGSNQNQSCPPSSPFHEARKHKRRWYQKQPGEQQKSVASPASCDDLTLNTSSLLPLWWYVERVDQSLSVFACIPILSDK
ncbi:unnamed protein product [Ectocarpus sp. 12 AP-2014]